MAFFQSVPQEVNHCWRWSVFVASPGLRIQGFANLPFPEQLCRRLRGPRSSESWKAGASQTGTSLWPPGCAELGRRWRKMRRAYQTGWVGETCLGSQVVICPGFHLTDWLQSQWVPVFRDGLLLGAGRRRREHPSLFRVTAQLEPQASLSFRAPPPPQFSICCSLKISFWKGAAP